MLNQINRALIHPFRAPVLTAHFYYQFPSSKHHLSRYTTYLLNPRGFLDLRSIDEIKQEVIENYSKDYGDKPEGRIIAEEILAKDGTDKSIDIYRKVDSCLRKRFKTEDKALEAIGSAIDRCLNASLNWSPNPKDYLALYNLEAPIFEYILRTTEFENERQMYDFVLGG